MEHHKAPRIWGSNACQMQPGIDLNFSSSSFFFFNFLPPFHCNHEHENCHFQNAFCCRLIFLYSFIGYPSPRIPWELLQTDSNRHWPTCGLYILSNCWLSLCFMVIMSIPFLHECLVSLSIGFSWIMQP